MVISFKKHWALLPITGMKNECPVKITSRSLGGKVYVSRFVASRGTWSKRRWLIDETVIRTVEIFKPVTVGEP